MLSVSLEILIVLGLILVNSFLAMSEIAVVSSRKVRLQRRAQGGDKRAQIALELATKPARFLSTVQIGITLVGILAGAFSGATIARSLDAYLSQIPLLARYSGALSIVIVVVVITYLSLVIGELVPKQIALSDPERVSTYIAPTFQLLSRMTQPVVNVLSISSEFVLDILRIRPSIEPMVTEEEIRIMVGQGARLGVFERIEEELVDQVFRLGDLKVGALMTPRHEVIWLDVEDTLEELGLKVGVSGHTYYPVAKGSLDNILGIVGAKDLFNQLLQSQKIDLENVVQPPLFVPESLPVYHMLERFKESHSQIAIVFDEYGSIQGLVTSSDLLEALVGELPEGEEWEDRDIVQRQDGSWLIDGMVPMQEFKELFRINDLPGERENYYQTVGGFVMTYLGKIPSEGDSFEQKGIRFEVVDMDGRRVDKILVLPLDKNQSETDSSGGY